MLNQNGGVGKLPIEASGGLPRLSWVNRWEVMPMLLLVLFSFALSIGMGIIIAVCRRARLKPVASHRALTPIAPGFPERRWFFRRPSCWLAVKSRNVRAVQAALGLHHPKPCSWSEGLAGDEKLFIAPPVKGWIVVTGSRLPEPSEDVDACFRFLLELSRKLGQVQLFCASRILHHHAWIKVERGRVMRAYSWAGKTLWNQGALTAAEKELDLKCYDYTELVQRVSFGQLDMITTNVDKVPLLAARWSLDPARIDVRFLETERGIAGEPSWRY